MLFFKESDHSSGVCGIKTRGGTETESGVFRVENQLDCGLYLVF